MENFLKKIDINAFFTSLAIMLAVICFLVAFPLFAKQCSIGEITLYTFYPGETGFLKCSSDSIKQGDCSGPLIYYNVRKICGQYFMGQVEIKTRQFSMGSCNVVDTEIVNAYRGRHVDAGPCE